MKNRTLLFGEGLFETFRVYKGRKLAFAEDHLDRMEEGCTFFELPFLRQKAIEALKTVLLGIPGGSEARLRLDLVCYGAHRVEKTDFQTSWEFLQEKGIAGSQGVKLGFAPYPRFSRSPVVRFKTTSYLENIFVLRRARSHGLFDALFTNERNEMTEGSISNVFFVEKGQILTPPIDAGLLPGITRKNVLDVANKLGLPVAESPVLFRDLDLFDGIFVTNSVIEIAPVSTLDGKAYDVPPFMKALREEYRNRAEASGGSCNKTLDNRKARQ
jgi:branched-subunit amino acid aminotransferase/4-amino-4-deoxychorismate lyase